MDEIKKIRRNSKAVFILASVMFGLVAIAGLFALVAVYWFGVKDDFPPVEAARVLFLYGTGFYGIVLFQRYCIKKLIKRLQN